MSTYARITLDLLFSKVIPSGGQYSIDALTRTALLQATAQQIANGILLDQTNDYRELAQGLLIDYLLSGSANIITETSVGSVRDSLENLRVLLIGLGDDFDQIELQHKRSIAASQAKLIDMAKNLPGTEQIKHDTDEFFIEAQDMNGKLKVKYKDFYDALIKVKSTLLLVPEYSLKSTSSSAGSSPERYNL